MRYHRHAVRSLVASSCAFFLALACSDSTAPTWRRMQGTYDLSTVLDTYEYSYACVPTINGTICQDTTVAAGASRLYGTFTLGDTLPGTSTHMKFLVVNTTIHQADCKGSTELCPEVVAQYDTGTATVSRDSLTIHADMYGGMLIGFNGRMAGDAITGSIGWSPYLGCCVIRRYDGTFTAERRP